MNIDIDEIESIILIDFSSFNFPSLDDILENTGGERLQ